MNPNSHAQHGAWALDSQLSIRGVSRTFTGNRGQTTQALLPVDFEVRENDFVTILGPSGCGKSTLLRIVAGLDFPSTGQVLLDGQPIAGPGADRGVVFQSYTLFPWLNVAQNICFGLRERGLSQAEQNERSAFFIAKVGLRGFEDHYPKQLSGGMQQRTAIARALANDPKMLLLDEPFGALDNQTRVLMQELLLGIWESAQKTVLFVTHDIDEAIFMANRVVVFSARPGRIRDRDCSGVPASASLHDQNLARIHGGQGAPDGRDPRRIDGDGRALMTTRHKTTVVRAPAGARTRACTFRAGQGVHHTQDSRRLLTGRTPPALGA